MKRLALISLLALGCASSNPESLPQSQAPVAPAHAETTAPSVDEPATHARAPGTAYCRGDGCPALPPPCAFGQVQSVTGPGGCWDGCVPLTNCSCERDEDCAGAEGSRCLPSGRCGYDCHTEVRSPIEPPECPVGQTLAVVNGTWGPCVPASACGCATDADCRQIRGYSELCYVAAGHCGPAL